MGEHQVKNIAKPVTVYRVKFDGATAPPLRTALAAKPFRARHAVAAALAVALLLALGTLAWIRPWTSATELAK